MTDDQVRNWMKARLPHRFKPKIIKGVQYGVVFRPTTTDLRRFAADPTVPKEVKTRVYVWIRFRRRKP